MISSQKDYYVFLFLKCQDTRMHGKVSMYWTGASVRKIMLIVDVIKDTV